MKNVVRKSRRSKFRVKIKSNCIGGRGGGDERFSDKKKCHRKIIRKLFIRYRSMRVRRWALKEAYTSIRFEKQIVASIEKQIKNLVDTRPVTNENTLKYTSKTC